MIGSAVTLALVTLVVGPPGPNPVPLPADPFVVPAEAGQREEGPEFDGEEAEPEAGPRTHGRLRGTIKAFGREDRLVGARVIPTDGSPGTETNERGEFELWLPPGTHDLVLRADGFQDRRVTVSAEVGVEQVYEYRLDEALDGKRYRTVVEGEREVAVSKTVLRDEEIHDVPGTGGDPFRVVSSLPGASQVAGFLPYVGVRGAAPGNTGYYLDSARVPILFHVAVGPSVIHPYFIDAVDFYPSGAPVRLGRYTNGIIEGRTRPARRDRVHGEVDMRLTDAGGLVEIPLNRPIEPGCEEERRRDCKRGDPRGALTLAGRYSYTGGLLSLIPQLNLALQFWDYQARFDHDLGPRARYVAFAYGSFDSIGQKEAIIEEENGAGDFVQRVDRNPDPFVRFDFHRVDQRIIHRWRGDATGTYALTLGFDRTGLDASAGDSQQVAETNEWRVAPRMTVRKRFDAELEMGVGLDHEFQFFRIPNDPSEVDPERIEDIAFFLSNRFVSATGLWVDLRWNRGPIEVRPGIRGDAYLQVGPSPILPAGRAITNAFGIDPRLLVRQTLNSRWTLRQAVGMYHQPPAAPIPLPGIESLGFDRGLQRNVQGSVGYEFNVLDAALLTQDVYVGRLSNLQDYELAASDTGDQANELEDFIIRVTGWSYGLETMLKLDPTMRVYGWVAYTLSRSTRDFPVGGRVPSTWDQTHILNFVLGYKIGQKWRVGGRVHFNTGRPYTAAVVDPDAEPPDDDEETPEETAAVDALRNNRNAERLPYFFQLDARIERIWRFQRWQLHLYLDLANATLQKEIFGCGGLFGVGVASQDDEETMVNDESVDLPGCRDPQGIRYVLPSLGLRGVF